MIEDQTEANNIFTTLSGLPMPDYNVIFEIGAAVGLDTPRIMETVRFNNGEYYAIEPEPENLKLLKNVSPLGESGRFILPIAIGNRNCRTTFYRSSNENQALIHTFSGSVKQPLKHLEIHPWCKFDTTMEVQMVRLDDLVSLLTIGPISLIWSDIQGAEDWLIDGGRNALKRTRYFYTEYNDQELYEGQINAERMLDMLSGNWTIVHKWSNDVLFENLAFE